MKLTNMNFKHRSVFALYSRLLQDAYYIPDKTASWIIEKSNTDYEKLSESIIKYATTVLTPNTFESDTILSYFYPIPSEELAEKYNMDLIDVYDRKREVIKQIARTKNTIDWLQFNIEPKGY